ncbi:MAG: hypothetical protein CFK52_14430, partial [Chloracidobacterium sp. CP2_5A]
GFDPGSGASSAVYALALQADGRLVAGGVFASFAGAPRAGVARLLGDDPGCASAVAPTTASFSALGGEGVVTVTAAGDCTWRAVSNVPWITILSGATGSGNGAVTYRVAAHRGRQRSGTLTVSGRAVTITQAVSAQETLGLFRRADGFFYLRNSLTSGVADTAFF